MIHLILIRIVMTKEKRKEVAKYLFGIGMPFLITGIVELFGCPELSQYAYLFIGVFYIILAAIYWK